MLSAHDQGLLLLAAGAVALVIGLITRYALHPFLALMLASLALSLAGGGSVPQALRSYGQGFGDTLASVGTVLALGAMFGALLSASRGAERLAGVLVGLRGPRFAPWAMALLAMLLGLPMFFETGVVMIMPIIIAVGHRLENDPARLPSASPYLLAGLPALAGLSVMHGLVPPHPGPLVAISALQADLGVTLVLGLVVAVPTVVVAGPLFALWVARRARAQPPAEVIARLRPGDGIQPLPGTAVTVATILCPVAIMLAKAAADLSLASTHPLRAVADFTGAPAVALLLGTLLAMHTFGRSLGQGRGGLTKLMGDALPPVASIMLVIGAGGAFKQALIDLGLGSAMAHAAEAAHLSPLLLGWGAAVLIRLATGSATVATVTAAGLLATHAAIGSGPAGNALLALSIGAGSLFFSHVNDAGFWLVKGVLGTSLPDTFKTWSALETIISVMGLVLVLGLSLLL